MKRERRLLFALMALLVLAETAWGQRALSWRGYRVADGLSESACSSVTVSLNGKVLATHLRSATVSELDGYTITNIPSPTAEGGRVAESPGGQIWAVVQTGLTEWSSGKWILHPVREIAAQLRSGTTRPIHPIPFCPVKQGCVLFLLPDRLMEFDMHDPGPPQITELLTASQLHIGSFSGMTVADDGGLWISGTRGLAKAPASVRSLSAAVPWQEHLPPTTLGIQDFREPLQDDQGGVTCVAEAGATGQKVAAHFDGQHWEAFSAGAEKIRYAWYGRDHVMGAASIDTLYQWRNGRMIENDDISARQYMDAAVGPDGALWLATSDGLFRHAPLTWRTPVPARQLNAFIQCEAADLTSRIWFVTGGSLYSLRNDSLEAFPLPDAAVRHAKTHSIRILKDGALLLADSEDLFKFNPASQRFVAIPPPPDVQRFNLLGAGNDGRLCFQDFATAARKYRLDLFDGTRFRPLPVSEPPADIGTELSAMFATQNGDAWLSGQRGVAWWHDNQWQTFVSHDQSAPQGATGFIELADAKIWCAAQDRIWEFDGRNWLVVRVGFDRINSLLRARDGSVWVSSSSGLYHFWHGAWIENGMEEGLPSAYIQEIGQAPDGRLWAATARGLSLYHPAADLGPPVTRIRILGSEADDQIPEGGTLNLLFNGTDKWKFTPVGRLLYSYRLDQHDWSPFQELNAVSFAGLAAGKHYFQVRAMDRNGNIEHKPAQLEFAVALPWYKESRLLSISLCGLALVLFFAALAFNRHKQLLRSYAAVELKVAERTRQLEIANRELLQSQKMKALGTLAAGIAHDFNNILSIIKGSAQIIEDNADNPSKIRVRADRIKTMAEQGAGIVQAMLGFSRGSDEKPTLCDLNAIAAETIKLLGDRFLRGVQVQFEPAPDVPPVPAVKEFIQQILLNFIFNAAESAPQDRRVVLATRRMEEPPAEMTLMPAPALAYVSISVQDFGCGIPPENLPRIFEPFFTTKALSTRRGTGLGLSTVYELAKKMDAGLAVESVVNQGSVFILILPIRALKPHLKQANAETVSAPTQP